MQSKVVKICVVILFLVFYSSTCLNSQNKTQVELFLYNGTINDMIILIEDKTDYTFVYKNLDLSQSVSNILNSTSITGALRQAFRGVNIDYKIRGNKIYLEERGIEKNAHEVSEQRMINGVVLDTKGETLIGASISIKGETNLSAVTDIHGAFNILATPSDFLEISYLGFKESKILVGNNSTLKITLLENDQFLNEVVVVGYGEQKKVNLTGAISSIDSENIENLTVSNLSNSLAGRASGVMITGTSGLIGASSDIRIRGSFDEPLYVIDGITSSKNLFDALDTREIDQISFLKDASTATIYGMAAGNGVVLVTTKKGDFNNTKPKFTYQGTYTFSNPTQKLMANQFNAIDELTYQNRVAEFRQVPLPNGAKEFDYFKDKDYNVLDWIWRTPWNTKHTITATGGNENIQAYVLGGFLKEEGAFVTLKNQKYNLRSNLTAKLSHNIKMNVNLSGHVKDMKRFYWPGTDEDDYSIPDLYRSTFNVPHTYPFYLNEDGSPSNKVTPYPLYPSYGGWTGWNVVDQIIGNRYQKKQEKALNAILIFDFDLGNITKGLKAKILGQYGTYDVKQKRYLTFQKNYGFPIAPNQDNRFVPGPINHNDVLIYNFNEVNEEVNYKTSMEWSEQLNAQITYNNTFGKHEVSTTLVFEQAKRNKDQLYAAAMDPLTQYDQWFVFSNDPLKRRADASEHSEGRLSWIGRLNYIFNQKYIAEFTFRADGDDRFAPSSRWGFFPSVSGAWRVSEEKFMTNTKEWLSNLKLRFSYGTAGSKLDINGNIIGQYQYIDRYNEGTEYIFGAGSYTGIQVGNLSSPKLTWATSQTYNSGFDFGILNHRLSGTVDVFYRRESNILGPRTASLPTTFGRELAPENYAKRSWRGSELSINWHDEVRHDQINYSVYANIGYARDQWELIDESSSYARGNLRSLSRIGSPHDRVIGYIAKGIIRTQEQLDRLLESGFTQFGRKPFLGAILYDDTRGAGYAEGADGKIDYNDSFNLLSKNGFPRINYGFGGNISYKGLSLSIHFQGVGKYDRFIGGDEGGFPQWGGASRPYYPLWASDNVWTPENSEAKYPRATGENWYESGSGVSTFWKRNGAYLRLKNLNIGYNIPQKILLPMGISESQIFMNGSNLFFISAIGEFHDPEQKNADSFPIMRSFTFGLNISF